MALRRGRLVRDRLIFADALCYVGGQLFLGSCRILHGFFVVVSFFIARQGDIRTGLEELFPELQESMTGVLSLRVRVLTLEPSQTSRECSVYCSTSGRILVVTIR